MTEKKKKWDKKFSIEELYQNKNFVPPKEKSLETIFEEPRKAKDGAPILTSVRKYKRYLHFDPTEGKIHKRKLKAKKCISNLKSGKTSRTRSSAKKPKCVDISMYIMEAIGESSDSEMEATNDRDEDANTKDSSNLSDDALKQSHDSLNDIVEEEIETKKDVVQEPDFPGDKTESQDVKETEKSPSRSSCIVT